MSSAKLTDMFKCQTATSRVVRFLPDLKVASQHLTSSQLVITLFIDDCYFYNNPNYLFLMEYVYMVYLCII